MTTRRIGLYGIHEESLRLARLLESAADVEIVRYFETHPAPALEQARRLDPGLAAAIERSLVSDFDAFLGSGDLAAVVDDGHQTRFLDRCPDAGERGIQVVSPLTARLLWGRGGEPRRDRKAELLEALSEVVESVEMTIDSDELFTRMLETAVSITGAEGGSLMLLSEAERELRVKVAFGVEPELWPKIRVALGEGIAGRVAETAVPLRIEGRADPQHFAIKRERLDLESALCVPLIHAGQVLGVLNLHHSTRAGAFSEQDLHFLEQLAGLDAQIIHRAQEHETLKNQAARYEAVRDIHALLSQPGPLPDRLQRVCAAVAERMGRGIANLYLSESEARGESLRHSATSLAGGSYGADYRIVLGQGIDGRAAQTRAPIFLNGDDAALAYAALPLIVDDKLIGVLSAQAGDAPPRGEAARVSLLEIANAVGEEVARSRHEAHMSARATRMSAINETGIRMLSTRDPGELARLATSSLAMILDADHAVLRLQDPETRRYKVAAYYGSADEALQPRLFELDKQTAVEAINRRTVFLRDDLARHAKTAEFAVDFSSLIAAPLKSEGQIIGTLAIYDKITIDRFFAGHFDDEDMQVFARYVSYVERAVSQARHQPTPTPSDPNLDAETGLPNAHVLEARVREEIARAGDRPGTLAVASCRIENRQQIIDADGPDHARRVLAAVAEALRSTLRDFDVLARSLPDGFQILLPEPGPDADVRVGALARHVADRICRSDDLNRRVRVNLAFGFASHPNDGHDPDTLLEHAAAPRIRMA